MGRGAIQQYVHRRVYVILLRESRKEERMGKRNRKNTANQRRQAEPAAGVRANVNRHYKDTVFRMLFKEKKRALGLYNAISGKQYTDSEKLEVITLENAIYMGMKNDLAFLVDCDLYLLEHQSTINRNMPFRFLQYVSDEYSKLTVSDDMYGEKLVRVPTPHFLVFYNGVRAFPERQELKLSEAFQTPEAEPQLELRVQVLNINEGFNNGLKEQCETLAEYMQYVEKVRSYVKVMPIGDALDRAVNECIEQGILREFLLRNKAEVKHMSIYEYDEEASRRALRENAYEEGEKSGEAKGEKKGKINSILLLLEDIGPVPAKLREEITAETDDGRLKKWLRTAAHAESIDDFIKEK